MINPPTSPKLSVRGYYTNRKLIDQLSPNLSSSEEFEGGDSKKVNLFNSIKY